METAILVCLSPIIGYFVAKFAAVGFLRGCQMYHTQEKKKNEQEQRNPKERTG